MTRVLDQHHGAAAGTTSTTDGGEDWRHQAACLDHDPELWFAADEERVNRRKPRVAKAIAICGTCPVADPCLTDALRHNEQWAVRGGIDLSTMSQRSRYRLRAAQDAA